MHTFDYGSEAMLYVARNTAVAGDSHCCISFLLASDAIRFAIEETALAQHSPMCLVVDEVWFTGAEIRRLYDSTAYPLVRKLDKEIDHDGEKPQVLVARL
jgi:hypothetical protein